MQIESFNVVFRASKKILPTLPSSILRQLPAGTGSVTLTTQAPERGQPFKARRSPKQEEVVAVKPSSREVKRERAHRKLVDAMWAAKFRHLDAMPRPKPAKAKPLTAKQETAWYNWRFPFGRTTRNADIFGYSSLIIPVVDPEPTDSDVAMFSQVSAMAYDKVLKVNEKTGRERLVNNDELTIPYGKLCWQLSMFDHPANERMAHLVFDCIPEMPTVGCTRPINADMTWCEHSDGSSKVGGWRTAERTRTEVVEIEVGDVSEAKAAKPHFSKKFLAKCSDGDAEALATKAKIEADFIEQAEAWRKTLADANTTTLRKRVNWTAPEQSGLTAVDNDARAEGDAIEQMNGHNRFMREVMSMLPGWSPTLSTGLRTTRGTWMDKWCDRLHFNVQKKNAQGQVTKRFKKGRALGRAKVLKAPMHNSLLPAPSYRKNDAIKVWCRIVDNQAWMRSVKPHAARGLTGVKVHTVTLNPTRKDKQQRAVNNLRRELALSMEFLKKLIPAKIMTPEQVVQIVAAGNEAVLKAGAIARRALQAA